MSLKLRSDRKMLIYLSNLVTVGLLLASLAGSSSAAGGDACSDLFNRPAASIESPAATPWFSKIQFAATENTLRTMKIASVKDLKASMAEDGKKPSGTTLGMLLITFADGSKAIWKPGSGKLAEVAAYRVARLVGSRLVPPTVERTLDANSFQASVPPEMTAALIGRTGSLQSFIPTSIDLTTTPGSKRAELWEKVPKEQRAQRDIYNFVFGNWDLHWGNVLVDDSHSIVQIDNEVIRSRVMVRFGELPFIRRLSFSKSVREAMKDVQEGPFPFAQAVYLDKPTIAQFVIVLRTHTDPEDLANYVRNRMIKIPSDVLEPFVTLVRTQAPPDVLERYVAAHVDTMSSANINLSMKIVLWDRAVWIQGIGFQNYGPINPPEFSERVLDAYRKLTFESLRSVLPESLFRDQALKEMLWRRDQILEVARQRGTVP